MSNEGKKILAAGLIISLILLSLIMWLIIFEPGNYNNSQMRMNDNVNKSSLKDNELKRDSINQQVDQRLKNSDSELKKGR